MKVLFLDIDGVVNCASTTQKFGPYVGIDPVKADLVRDIIEKTGVKVVLSSTWRLYPEHLAEVKEKVCAVEDVTPDLPHDSRGLEVNTWLSEHPEVEKWAALDDVPDFLPGQTLFETSWEEGLTPEVAQQVINYFGLKET